VRAALYGGDAPAGGHGRVHGKPVQAEPSKSMLKAPGNERLKLKRDILASTSAF